MFIAVLFVIAKTWRQPKYPSVCEWVKKPQNTAVPEDSEILLSTKRRCKDKPCKDMEGL